MKINSKEYGIYKVQDKNKRSIERLFLFILPRTAVWCHFINPPYSRVGKDCRAVSAFHWYDEAWHRCIFVGRVIPYKICGSKYSTITNLAGNFYHLQYTIYTIRLQYPIFVKIALLPYFAKNKYSNCTKFEFFNFTIQ